MSVLLNKKDALFMCKFEKYLKKGITVERVSRLMELLDKIITTETLFNMDNEYEYVYAVLDKLTDVNIVSKVITEYTYTVAVKEWNDFILMQYNVYNDDYTCFFIGLNRKKKEAGSRNQKQEKNKE